MAKYQVAFGTVEQDGQLYGPNHDEDMVVLPDSTADFLGNQVRYRGEVETEDDDEDVDEDFEDSLAGEWLTDYDGVGESRAERLVDEGYIERHHIENASVEDLANVDGISESVAETLKNEIGD